MKIFKPVFHSVIALTLCLSLSSCDNAVIKEKWDLATNTASGAWNDFKDEVVTPTLQKITGTEPTPKSYFLFELLDDGTYAIWAKDPNNMPNEIILPDTYRDAPVTTVKWHAFYGCKSIKSITFPASIRYIDDGALGGCPNIESIEVQKGNENYHSEGNCLIDTYMKEVVIGCKTSVIPTDGSVKRIGKYSFQVASPANMVIPDSVWYIEHGAFYFNQCLESITIPDKVLFIDEFAFYGCKNLKEVSLGSGISTIRHDTFAQCESLESIIIPDGVTVIEKGAFSACRSLSHVDLPDSLDGIDEYAFSGCYNLRDLTLPNNLIRIGHHAFSVCTSLSVVIIPDSVRTIDTAAFENCTSLISVVIGYGVTEISDHLFRGCTNLRAVLISQNVKSYGLYDAFEDCPNVEIIIY